MIRFGIIGAGRMGTAHAGEMLKHGAKVTRVYDVKPEAAQAMREKTGAAIVSSAAELASSPDVDCVFVTSPSYCHREGIEAAVAVHKPVFCEKPLCREEADVEAMYKVLKAYDLPYTCGFVRRQMTKTRQALDILRSGKLGRIRFCNIDLPFGGFKRLRGDWFADFESSGGVALDMMAHHMDLCNLFFGEAVRVYADGIALDPAQPLPADHAAGIVTYKSGVICSMFCTWQRFGRTAERMEIYGENGCITLDGEDAPLLEMAGEKAVRLTAGEAAAPSVVEEVKVGDAFSRQMGAIIRLMTTGERDLLATPDDAYASVKIGLAMLKSMATGEAVKL